MQWLLTAVVLGAACWMVSALTYEDEGAAAAPAGRATATVTVQAIKTASRGVWWLLRIVGLAFVAVGRAVEGAVGRTWTATRARRAARARARTERRQLAEARQRYRVPFEKSLIVTGPQDEAAVGVALPTFSAYSRRPSALSRLLAFIQLMFFVVLWGSGAALAIAGAAWAVLRFV